MGGKAAKRSGGGVCGWDQACGGLPLHVALRHRGRCEARLTVCWGAADEIWPRIGRARANFHRADPMAGRTSGVLLLLTLTAALLVAGELHQTPAYALQSPYLQAALDPTIPAWTLTFNGYSEGQWYAQMDILWLEERQPDGTPVFRIGFPSDSVAYAFNSTTASGIVNNLAVLSQFSNNACAHRRSPLPAAPPRSHTMRQLLPR